MPRIIVIGGGIGGLAASAILARAGNEVKLIEGQSWLGGKSRRITIDGQRIDTGPSMVTFPGALDQIFTTYDQLGSQSQKAKDIAGIRLRRLPEVGRYFFRSEQVNLPVENDHPWSRDWQQFQSEHGYLGPEITKLLTTDPRSLRVLSSVTRLLARYGSKLTTQRYLDSLGWMPPDLKEIIAIHTLNAGVSPDRTLAMYASMAAVMASDGVYVPEGGVYEIVKGLENLARHAGVSIKKNEPVIAVDKRHVVTTKQDYEHDYVVCATDGGILDHLLGKKMKPPKKLSCSGVAVFGVLRENLPLQTVTHSVMLPDNPERLFEDLTENRLPSQTMAFLNYYAPNTIYPNDKPVAALLLTAPPNGMSARLTDPFVQSEAGRFSKLMGLERNITEMMTKVRILDPEYFAGFGSIGGALYGSPTKWWRSGPLHSPSYSSPRRPWLWRVGSSVHPGGGIPAVLGGTLISTRRLLRVIDL